MLSVKTPVFEGPLDLLLHLIEREDLDITAVSLVQVTDQYLAALHAETPGGRAGSGRRSLKQSRIDLRALADFVAVGAKLLFLKSRALLPRTADDVEADALEAEAIAEDLTAQLEEYRAFKNAAAYLRDLDAAGHRSYARVAPPPLDWLPTGLERVTMRQLLKALAQALVRLPAAPAPLLLQRSLVNVAERRLTVLAAVQRRGSLTFSRLVANCKTRLEAIVTFLAVLDLLKSEAVVVSQYVSFGDITLRPAGQSPEAAATA